MNIKSITTASQATDNEIYEFLRKSWNTDNFEFEGVFEPKGEKSPLGDEYMGMITNI